eukprot:TRINITY_DN9612_c0_g1_i12.p1 TRINITY_DN9612_c0_g1~~TRINITY_DN9612_c0_g1_i12.p1  ORF type:complete len:234 (-),score=44.09 TRINITY_DN9612_c0_g1_i12:133-834(-)
MKKVTELAMLYYWPRSGEAREKVHLRDVAEDPRKLREHLFPVRSVVVQAESINMKHFEKSDGIAMELSVEAHVKAPGFWVVHFLKGHPIKMSYEDIYKLYKGLEKQDVGNAKWELRMEVVQVVCCALWIISSSENRYDMNLLEKPKTLIRSSLENAKENLESLGKTISPYAQAYTKELLNRMNEWMHVWRRPEASESRRSTVRAVRKTGTADYKEKEIKEDTVKQFLESLKPS